MEKETVILSIDPGYERLGLAILAKNNKGKIRIIWSECYKTSAKIPFADRLLELGLVVEKLIEKYSPTICAIENLFMQNNQKTVMQVSEVRGTLIYIAKKHKLTTFDLNPLQIKSAVTGTGKSDKAAVQKMVILLLPELKNTSKKIDDEYDAIACGLTYFALEKSL